MLKRKPLGSFPMNRCTYSVPWSCTAIAYLSGFTHDCRQNGTLVSPTVCLCKRVNRDQNQRHLPMVYRSKQTTIMILKLNLTATHDMKMFQILGKKNMSLIYTEIQRHSNIYFFFFSNLALFKLYKVLLGKHLH